MTSSAVQMVLPVHPHGLDGSCVGYRVRWARLSPHPCWQVEWATSRQARASGWPSGAVSRGDEDGCGPLVELLRECRQAWAEAAEPGTDVLHGHGGSAGPDADHRVQGAVPALGRLAEPSTCTLDVGEVGQRQGVDPPVRLGVAGGDRAAQLGFRSGKVAQVAKRLAGLARQRGRGETAGLDPGRLVARGRLREVGLGGPERRRRLGPVARRGVPPGGENGEQRGRRRGRPSPRPGEGRGGESQCLRTVSQVDSLMRHRPQRETGQRPIVRLVGQPQRLEVVPLGHPVQGRIERLPAREIGQLGGGTEHGPTILVGREGALEVAGHVGGEVLDHGEPCMPAAEPLVGPAEHREHVTYGVDLAATHRRTPAPRAPTPLRDVLPGVQRDGKRSQ
ncbi:hypothetical protein B5D80_25025 [Micromonospora wenchangensis]|uniref:Uncharacterized protein n=1 Tax=Micromonospora wenchangensis TaxID=1185415 RepID=A0A246RHX4_9ACTN|nr:hypothetical protein B5D80_25025 [Micromonospora wenchangensis]